MSHVFHFDNRFTKKLIVAMVLIIALVTLFGCGSKENTSDTSQNPPVTDFSFPEVENQHYTEGLAFLEAHEYEKAEASFLSAIDELKAQGLSDGEMQIAVVENELGKMYLELERYKDSYDYLMSSYISFRDRYGEDAEWTLLAKTSICQYDKAVGNYDLAIANALDIYEQTGSDLGKVQTATLLGIIYMNASNYESAESWYQKAAELGKKVDGYDFTDLYNNYGVLLMYKEDWEKSLKYLQAAVQAVEKHGGIPVSQIKFNIAQVYIRMGDDTSAKETINDLIAHDTSKYGERSSYAAYDYMVVSRIYQKMNDWENQFQSLNTAIDIMGEIEGENSHIMSVLYSELTAYYNRRGDDQHALSCANKAIEIKKNILEENSDGARVAYGNLGTVLLRMGDGNAAFEAFEKEYEIATLLFGEDDLRIKEAQIDLADACVKTGDLEAAGQYAEEGIAKLQIDSLDNESLTVKAYNVMGRIYAAKGQSDQAKDAWYKAVDILQKSASGASIIIVISNQLGDLCLDAGDYAEAKDNYIRCVESIKELYSLQSESTLYVNNVSVFYLSIGFCSYKLEDYDDALHYYDLGEELLTRYLDGKKDSEIENSKLLYKQLASIYSNIAAVYEDTGKTEKAVKYAQKSYQIVVDKGLDKADFQKLLERMKRLNIPVE